MSVPKKEMERAMGRRVARTGNQLVPRGGSGVGPARVPRVEKVVSGYRVPPTELPPAKPGLVARGVTAASRAAGGLGLALYPSELGDATMNTAQFGAPAEIQPFLPKPMWNPLGDGMPEGPVVVGGSAAEVPRSVVRPPGGGALPGGLPPVTRRPLAPTTEAAKVEARETTKRVVTGGGETLPSGGELPPGAITPDVAKTYPEAMPPIGEDDYSGGRVSTAPIKASPLGFSAEDMAQLNENVARKNLGVEQLPVNLTGEDFTYGYWPDGTPYRPGQGDMSAAAPARTTGVTTVGGEGGYGLFSNAARERRNAEVAQSTQDFLASARARNIAQGFPRRERGRVYRATLNNLLGRGDDLAVARLEGLEDLRQQQLENEGALQVARLEAAAEGQPELSDLINLEKLELQREKGGREAAAAEREEAEARRDRMMEAEQLYETPIEARGILADLVREGIDPGQAAAAMQQYFQNPEALEELQKSEGVVRNEVMSRIRSDLLRSLK